jgi:hypothetical protein
VSWWPKQLKIPYKTKSTKQLTAMSGDVVGRATSTGAISGFGLGRLTFGGCVARGMTRDTHNPLKLFGLAFGTSKLYLLFLVPQQELKTVVAFQTSEFIYRHNLFLYPLLS